MPEGMVEVQLHGLFLDLEFFGLLVRAFFQGLYLQQYAFGHIGVGQHIGQMQQDLLFVDQLLAQFAAGGGEDQQEGILERLDGPLFRGVARLRAEGVHGIKHKSRDAVDRPPQIDLFGLQSALGQFAYREQSVHLVGTLVDLGDSRVAIAHFDPGFLSVAHAAEDLDGFVGRVAHQIGAFHLDERGLHGEFAHGLQFGFRFREAGGEQFFRFEIDQVGRAIEGRFDGKGLHAQIADLVLDGSEIADRLAELLSLGGIGGGLSDRELAAPYPAGAGLDAAAVEDIEGHFEAFVALAQQIFEWHLAIVEVDLHGRGALDAHFLFFRPDGEAWKIAFDDKGRQVLVAREAREHDEHIGEASVGDPDLLSVEEVVIAPGRQFGRTAPRIGVGACFRLRQGVGGDPFAGGDARQVLLLLGFVAVIHDRQAADGGLGADGGGEREAQGHVFGEERVGLEIESHPAILFRNADAAEAQLAGFADQGGDFLSVFLLGHLQFAAAAGHGFLDLGGTEFDDQVADHELLLAPVFGKKEVHPASLSRKEVPSLEARVGRFGGCPGLIFSAFRQFRRFIHGSGK